MPIYGVCWPNYDRRTEPTNVLTGITRKEQTNTMTDIRERATVIKKTMEHASVMCVITYQYGT